MKQNKCVYINIYIHIRTTFGILWGYITGLLNVVAWQLNLVSMEISCVCWRKLEPYKW